MSDKQEDIMTTFAKVLAMDKNGDDKLTCHGKPYLPCESTSLYLYLLPIARVLSSTSMMPDPQCLHPC
jgi:hypothetical protein